MNNRGTIIWLSLFLIFFRVTALVAEKPERNPNPYAGIDWKTVNYVQTTSHVHINNQARFDLYAARGDTFFTISNYYPSVPYYPLRDIRKGQFRVRQEHSVIDAKTGRELKGPFEWSKIIEPWKDELKPQMRAMLPFRTGNRLIGKLCDGFMEAPNAEHVGFSESSLHCNGLGSFYRSGTFDHHYRFQTDRGHYSKGIGLPWKEGMRRILAELQYSDGGGITINHPAWSRFSSQQLCEFLDFDSRVLGIEVYNAGSDKRYLSETHWDAVLSTGRQCFGFFVPDWDPKYGVNILLVPKKTPHECLKAYRDGRFYGAILGGGVMKFTELTWNGEMLKVSVDHCSHIQVISRKGVVIDKNVSSLELKVPRDQWEAHGYLRVRAFGPKKSDEMIFSNPFMLQGKHTDRTVL